MSLIPDDVIEQIREAADIVGSSASTSS